MLDQSPATPAVATAAPAAPGSAPAVITTPPAVAPAASEGSVTISTDKFAQLTRDAARGRSAQQRAAVLGPTRAKVPDGVPADAATLINEANERAEKAERIALQEQVRGQVRDMLDKEEYKNLPKSTRDLILKNPATLTQAETLEVALLDIEDFVRDQVIPLDLGLGAKPAGSVTTVTTPAPAGTETPPTNGTPAAPAGTPQLEDLSKLTGPARSQAAIRNALKTGANKA